MMLSELFESMNNNSTTNQDPLRLLASAKPGWKAIMFFLGIQQRLAACESVGIRVMYSFGLGDDDAIALGDDDAIVRRRPHALRNSGIRRGGEEMQRRRMSDIGSLRLQQNFMDHTVCELSFVIPL